MPGALMAMHGREQEGAIIMMTLIDLIADYAVLHLTAEYRYELAEFVEAYLEEMTSCS